MPAGSGPWHPRSLQYPQSSSGLMHALPHLVTDEQPLICQLVAHAHLVVLVQRLGVRHLAQAGAQEEEEEHQGELHCFYCGEKPAYIVATSGDESKLLQHT